MSSARLTLIGLYNEDKELFDGLEVPEEVEKDLLVDSILLNGGEYEVIYSDPNFLKMAISSWSKQWKPTFTEWCRAYEDLKEVAPLENYDRLENWSDSANTSENESLATSENESLSTSEATSGSTSVTGSDSSQGSESMSEQNGVSAFDVSTYSPADNGSRSTSSSSQGATSSQTQNATGLQGRQDRTNTGTSNRNQNRNDYSTHGGRIHGNIGVTTSAQMYAEWMTTLQNYGNIYDRISKVFLQNFVIPIL